MELNFKVIFYRNLKKTINKYLLNLCRGPTFLSLEMANKHNSRKQKTNKHGNKEISINIDLYLLNVKAIKT